MLHANTKNEITHYLPEYGQGQDENEACKKLIYNPFNVKPKDLPDKIQNEVTELQNDSKFRDLFEYGVIVV